MVIKNQLLWNSQSKYQYAGAGERKAERERERERATDEGSRNWFFLDLKRAFLKQTKLKYRGVTGQN